MVVGGQRGRRRASRRAARLLCGGGATVARRRARARARRRPLSARALALAATMCDGRSMRASVRAAREEPRGYGADSALSSTRRGLAQALVAAALAPRGGAPSAPPTLVRRGVGVLAAASGVYRVRARRRRRALAEAQNVGDARATAARR